MAEKQSDKQPEAAPKRPPPIIVNDAPKFDLESYISNYEGLTRSHRLELIGLSSRVLGLEALHIAIDEALAGRNVERYLELVKALQSLRPTDPKAVINHEWADTRTRQVGAEADRLEHELKGYKNNLIKESIRMGNEDLATFYYMTGSYANAYKSYSKMREFCTTPKHLAEMSFKLLLTAIAQENWMAVQSSLYKLQNQCASLKPDDKNRIEPLLPPLRGLVSLGMVNYRDAATAFLQTDHEVWLSFADPAATNTGYIAAVPVHRAIISPNDIAIYTGLCALATFSRVELQQHLLDNEKFRQFLELEPQVRRAINCFCSAKYTACLQILESYKADYLLDIYLQRHVEVLYGMIRRKGIVAYCRPFARLTLSAMANTFKTTPEVLQGELIDQIRSGALDARIDIVDGVLIMKQEDERKVIYTRALEMAKEHERQLRLKMWRFNVIEAGMELQAPKDGDSQDYRNDRGNDGSGRSLGKGRW